MGTRRSRKNLSEKEIDIVRAGGLTKSSIVVAGLRNVVIVFKAVVQVTAAHLAMFGNPT